MYLIELQWPGGQVRFAALCTTTHNAILHVNCMEHVSLQTFLFDKSITGPSQRKRSSFIEGGIALHFCTLFWDSKLSDVSLSLHAQEPKCQLPCFYGEIVKITCILNLNQKGNTYKVSSFVLLANDRYKQDLFHVVHKCVKIVRLLNKSQYSRCSIFVTLLKPVIHLRQRNQHITVVLF